MKFLFSFQPFGEAKMTGTAITSKKDKAINAKMEIWKVNKSIVNFNIIIFIVYFKSILTLNHFTIFIIIFFIYSFINHFK